MSSDAITILVIVLAAGVLGAADAAIRRRALRRDRNGQCARCGKDLTPMQSVRVPVAGGEIHTLARVCPACASRDNKIRRFTWAILAVLFVVTIWLLWLR